MQSSPPTATDGTGGVDTQKTSSATAQLLVIDDDPLIREMVQDVARGEHMQVLALPGGKDLRPEMLRDKHLVILDLMMPGVDGVQVMDVIKKADPPPMLLLISGVDGPALETALRLAASKGLKVDSLSKPFRAKALIAALKKHLPAITKPPPSKPATSSEEVITSAGLMQAIAAGAISVDLMPIFSLHDSSLNSVEAVCRWDHPTLGLISADQMLVALSEPSTALVYFKAMFPQAVKQYLSLTRLSAGSQRLSVLLPSILLRNDQVIDFISETLSSSGVDPAVLTLDLHAADLDSELDATLQAQTRLQLRSIQLCLQNFDPQSTLLEKSLSSAFRTIKVNATGLAEPQDQVRVALQFRRLVEEAASAGISLIATGVHSADIHDQILAFGLKLAQGRHLCAPMSAQDLAAHLQDARLPSRRTHKRGRVSKRILLVEPNPFLQQVYAAHLNVNGVEVEISADGQSPQNANLKRPYHLVIVDTAPPAGLTKEQTKAMGATLAAHGNTPILALTEASSATDPQEPPLPSVDSYLQKPITLRSLSNECLRLLELDGSRR